VGGAWLGSTARVAVAEPGPAATSAVAILSGGALEARLARQEAWPGWPIDVWTLGGVYPSPTIRVRTGEILSARLDNRLPEPTNVHWHGLLVPSEMDGLPMDLANPGQALDYVFRVDQRAGTYWYHPHPDMRTAFQVYSGMAGFLIVEDDEERALGLPSGEFDVPILLQDRRLLADRSFRYSPSPPDLMNGYLGDVGLANGVPQGSLRVAAGLYRLRLLNGSNARIFRLGFGDGRSFDVIATDGGLLDRPYRALQLDLGPGERVEILVDFSRDLPGRAVALDSLPFRLFAPMGGMGGPSSQGTSMPLLRFEVERAGGAPARVPDRLSRLEPFPVSAVERTRSFVLAMGPGMMGGPPTINGRVFDAHRVDERVPAGALEIWEVSNRSTMPHPFHAHGVQFQVVDRRGAGIPIGPQDLGLKDTVLLWPNEQVRLAVRVGAHRGIFVLHCHNLEHEDAGMMSLFEIV
jgi:FtsP/CotA-like multicopper oxidase with cupredoxin domain